MLVGSRELEGFGAWVISARDLTHQRRIAELESLRHMYREIAAQTKTPLSLACSWIQRLQRKTQESGDDIATILQKTLVQLKKVNITYDRLALYSQGPDATVPKHILVNAGDLLKRTLDNLPQDLLSISGLQDQGNGNTGDPIFGVTRLRSNSPSRAQSRTWNVSPAGRKSESERRIERSAASH